MKAADIKLVWVQNNSRGEKLINRQRFIDIMASIKAGFDDNNEVSTELCELAEDVVEIRINKDRNDEMDTPFIICLNEEGKTQMYKISRRHRIMWEILNGYCRI